MEIKYIKDSNGNTVLPVTSTSAVRDTNGGSAEESLIDLKNFKNSAQSSIIQLNNRIADTYTKQEVSDIISNTPETDVIVIEVPSASQNDIAGWLNANTPSGTDPETGKSVRANKLYRVPGPDNTTFSEWAWNGTTYIMLANKDYGIDDAPVRNSNNVAKSGGIWRQIYDVTPKDSNHDFSIQDDAGNAIVNFDEGHLKTRKFDSRKSPMSIYSDIDFAVCDEEGNNVIEVRDGYIKTKKFDSSQQLESVNVVDGIADVSITDELGNNIAEFSGGHIRTKNFDSSSTVHKNKWNHTAEIFDFKLNNSLTQTEREMLGGIESAELSANGMTLPVGFSNAIRYQKYFIFDEERILLNVKTSSSDKILFFTQKGTSSDFTNNGNVSAILFDFTSGEISIFATTTFNPSTISGTVLKTLSFDKTGSEYSICIGRKRRAPYISIYNTDSMEKVEYTVDEGAFNHNIMRPAGWLYYQPCFCTIAGTPEYTRFSGFAPTNINMLFLGDSYTEGYGNIADDTWSVMAADYFGNSLTAGISGASLNDIIKLYNDCIKGKIIVKYVVISIGINDMLSGSDVTTFKGNLESFVTALIADGIIPIINKIWPEGSHNVTKAARGKLFNDAIREIGCIGADFSKVTGYDSEDGNYALEHLNKKGNELSYKVFVNELDCLNLNS